MGITPRLNVPWLADQLSDLEFDSEDDVGLIGAYALIGGSGVLDHLQHALKAYGHSDFDHQHWAGTRIMWSEWVPDGCLVGIACVKATIENAMLIFEQVLAKKSYAGPEGRGRLLDMRG